MSVDIATATLEDMKVEWIPLLLIDPQLKNHLFDKNRKNFAYVNHSVEVFNELAQQPGSFIQGYILENPYTPTSALNIIVDWACDQNYRFEDDEIKLLVNHDKCTVEMVNRLWEKRHLKHGITKYLPPIMPVEFFETVDKKPLFQLALASNPATPAHLLLKYMEAATNNDNYYNYDTFLFLEALASNPSVPKSFLTTLANQEPSKEVREALLLNPATPVDILIKYWENIVSWKDYSTMGLILRSSNSSLLLFQQKARVFVAEFVEENKRTFSWQMKKLKDTHIPTKADYLAVLKPYYPEANKDMPMDWLKDLIKEFTKKEYQVTRKETLKEKTI